EPVATCLSGLSLHDALPIYLFDVEQQVLDPQRSALADGRGLRGLEVRVAQCGQVAPAARERRQRRDTREQPPQHEPQRLAVLDRSEEHTSELQSRENLVCRL